VNPTHSQALADSLRQCPLLAGDLPEVPRFDRSKLAATNGGLDLNPDQKLGHLCEEVLRHLLIQSTNFRLIAEHLQIFSADRITLGELDFVLFEPAQKRYIHLELAVKFYLAVQVNGTWQYPGPDPRDHWERKLRRMESHQFRLAQSQEAKALLRLRWDIADIEPQHLIHGILFSPLHGPSAPLPRAVAPDCRQGVWLYQNQWDASFNHVKWVCLIPKYLWPMEINASLSEDLGLIASAELRRQAKQKCVLFTLPDSRTPHFLVPNGWPWADPENSRMR
jgi:hypothetical protein